jgi:hypothetical protein
MLANVAEDKWSRNELVLIVSWECKQDNLLELLMEHCLLSS